MSVGLGIAFAIVCVIIIVMLVHDHRPSPQEQLRSDVNAVFKRLELEHVDHTLHTHRGQGIYQDTPYTFTVGLGRRNDYQVYTMKVVVTHRSVLPVGSHLRVEHRSGMYIFSASSMSVLTMPRGEYRLPTQVMLRVLFGALSSHLTEALRDERHGLFLLVGFELNDETTSMNIEGIERVSLGSDAAHASARQALMVTMARELVRRITSLSDEPVSELHLYANVSAHLPTGHVQRLPIVHHLLGQHVDTPEGIAFWHQMRQSQRPEDALVLVHHYAERLAEELERDELHVLLSRALMNPGASYTALAQRLKALLTPTVLCEPTVHATFRIELLKQWLIHQTHTPEELEPCVTHMRAQFGKTEHTALLSALGDAPQRGGLSSADSSPRGALTASDQKE